MNDHPRVILSGFADETAHHKTALEQFVAMASIGLQYYTIPVHRCRPGHQERDEADAARDSEDQAASE